VAPLDDAIALDEDVTLREIAKRVVHREHVAAPDGDALCRHSDQVHTAWSRCRRRPHAA